MIENIYKSTLCYIHVATEKFSANPKNPSLQNSNGWSFVHILGNGSDKTFQHPSYIHLTAHRKCNGRKIDIVRKTVIKFFKHFGFNIQIETHLKEVNFFDLIF